MSSNSRPDDGEQKVAATVAAAPSIVSCAHCQARTTASVSVQLIPCGCWLCRDSCLIQFLTDTRLATPWECLTCGKVVKSHGAAKRGAAKPKKAVAAMAKSNKKQKKNKKTATTAATTPPTAAKRSLEKTTTENKNGDDLKQEVDGNPRTRKKYRIFTFNERMQQLQAFKDKFGHCAVPHRCPTEPSLGDWTKNVRSGKKAITQEERKELSAIGFVWETKQNRFDREWKGMLEKLKEYKGRFGDCYVPWQWGEDKKLAEWVHTQRKENSKGKLRDDRKLLLEEVGFAFKAHGSTGGIQRKESPKKERYNETSPAAAASEDSQDDDNDDDEKSANGGGEYGRAEYHHPLYDDLHRRQQQRAQLQQQLQQQPWPYGHFFRRSY